MSHLGIYKIRQKLLIAPECHFLFHGPLTVIAEIIEIQILVSHSYLQLNASLNLKIRDSFLHLKMKRVKLFTLP